MWKLRFTGTQELSWIPAPVGTRIQIRLVCPSLCHWMGLCLLVQVHGWWTSPSPEARLCRTLWCAAGWGCPCWSSYVDDGPDLPQRPSCTDSDRSIATYLRSSVSMNQLVPASPTYLLMLPIDRRKRTQTRISRKSLIYYSSQRV